MNIEVLSNEYIFKICNLFHNNPSQNSIKLQQNQGKKTGSKGDNYIHN